MAPYGAAEPPSDGVHVGHFLGAMTAPRALAWGVFVWRGQRLNVAEGHLLSADRGRAGASHHLHNLMN